jgi:hypothetical protein
MINQVFALVQLFTLDEPVPADDGSCGVEVLAIGASEEALQKFLADYKPRYEAASAEFDTWCDGDEREWSPLHDNKFSEVQDKHRVCGPLIPGARWEIVEVWDGQ